MSYPNFAKSRLHFFSPHFITLNSFSCHLIYIEYKGFTPFFLLSVSAFSFLGKRPCVQTKTHLRLRSNVLAFKIKRPCVSSQTHLRFRLNALAFFCLPICLKIRNGFQLDLYVWVTLYVGRILNIIIFKFQFQLNRSGTDVLIHTIFFFRVGHRQA